MVILRLATRNIRQIYALLYYDLDLNALNMLLNEIYTG